MSNNQGFYAGRVFPWLNDKLNADPQLEQLRAEALAPARGRVIEIGFGSGLNLPHYPNSVESIVAVDPSEGMRARPCRAWRNPASRWSHLNRRIGDLVRSNGFEFESVRQFFVPKMPRTHGWVTLGAARKVH